MSDILPAPHGDKLQALLQNSKLPAADRSRVIHAVTRYEQWREELSAITGKRETIISQIVALLNSYKRYYDAN